MEEEEDLKSVKSKPIGGIDDLSIEDLEEIIQDLNNFSTFNVYFDVK